MAYLDFDGLEYYDGKVFDTVGASVAPEFSSSSTYAVGEYVWYEKALYRCTAAITTAAAWDSSYWTQVTAGEEVADVKSDLSDYVTVTESDNLFDVNSATVNAFYSSAGAYTESDDYVMWEAFSVTGGNTLYGYRVPLIAYFDSDDTFISRTTSLPSAIPSNATTARVYAKITSNFYIYRETAVLKYDEDSATVFNPHYEYALNAKIKNGFSVYGTVANMVADTTLTSGYAYVSGYYTENDDGQGLYIIDSDSYNSDLDLALDNNHTASLVVGETVNPMQFGAYGDGSTDDADAIQKAVDTGADVVLTKSHYVSHSIVISTNYQRISGTDGTTIRTRGRLLTDVVSTSLTSGAILVINGTGTSVDGVGFAYTGDATGRTGIYVDRTNGTTRQEFDADTHITNCYFKLLNIGVEYIGRGLHAQGNLFGSCVYCISCHLPAVYDSDGDGYALVNPFGGRGINIAGNRSHSGSAAGTFVYVTGEKTEEYIGMVVEDNVIDHRGNLFYSEPMQRGLVLTGNSVVMNAYSSSGLHAVFVKYGDACNISNNTILAVRTQEDVDAEMETAGITYSETISHTPPEYAMSLGVDGYINNSVVSSNVIVGFTTGTIENGSITNSIIKNNVYSVELLTDTASVEDCVVSDNLQSVTVS